MKKHIVKGGNDLKLAVYEFGKQDAPAILFLHGVSQCYLSFKNQYESFLSDKYRIIIPDLRGHGASEKPEKLREYTNGELWADDINAILEHFELDKPTIVAWSYSGYVLLDYITKYGTSNIGSINFVSAAVMLSKSFNMVGDGLLSNVKNMSSKNLEDYVRGTLDFVKASTYKELPIEEQLSIVSYNSLTPFYVRKGMFTRVLDFEEILQSIDVPVLVSFGEFDTVILPEMSMYISQQINATKVSKFENCGHAVFFENAQKYNTELDEFCTKNS